MEAAPDLVAGDDIPADAEPNAEAVSSAVVEAEDEENAAAAPEEAPAEVPLPQNEVAAALGTQARIGGAEVWKLPGWPGDNVYRLIVRRQAVLLSGKEELEAEISPAMDALLRIFKSINDLSDSVDDGTSLESSVSGSDTCLVRLLVPSSQAFSLIGKKGETIKSIRESSNATVLIRTRELLVYAAPGERIIAIHGGSLKVLKALEAVIVHLRKFLVHHSVLPLFETSYNAPATQNNQFGNNYGLPMELDSSYLDHKSHLEPQKPYGGLALYGQDPSTSSLRSSALGHTDRVLKYNASATQNNQSFLGHTAQHPIVGSPMKLYSSYLDHKSHLEPQKPQGGLVLYWQDPSTSCLCSSALGHISCALEVTQKMQIPLSYAEDLIDITGDNIAYTRRSSGAAITIEESRELPGEVTVGIRGTSLQGHVAQQLVQEFIARHRETASSSYWGIGTHDLCVHFKEKL